MTASGLAVIVACALLAACGAKTDEAKGKGGAAAGGAGGRGGPVSVGFVVVQTSSVALTSELPGRVVAFQSSEVRPQVAGVIQRRLFTEGALVTRGQALYQIDSSLYRAAVGRAQADLQSAEANLVAAKSLADRYRPLAAIEAVSQQDYANAVAASGQAEASVSQAKAALETARINLNFTTVPAPISGRIGRSLSTVGALVTTNQTEPLATINQLDPMFVDIQQSSGELLALRRALASGGLTSASAAVRLTLEDGGPYDQVGRVEFSEAVVDPTTGTVTLRVRMANPRGVLLPGMFVRATFDQAINTQAILAPQTAVSRNPQGEASVFIVGPDNKAVQRPIVADRSQGAFWVVTKGLAAGDRVITQGLANVQPNTPLKAVPASTPQRILPKGAGDKASPNTAPAAKAGG